jgi:hypothetical protein
VFAGTDGAVSSSHTELVAAIDGTSVTIEGNQTAVAKVNGNLAAAWTVTLDVNNYISGIKLYNSASTSQFVVLTDTFLIAKPVAGGAPQPVFALGTNTPQGGSATAKLVLRGDIIADGTITSNAIVAGSIQAVHVGANQIITQSANIGSLTVDTLHLKDGTTTQVASYFNSNVVAPTAFTEVSGNTITVTGPPGTPVNIQYTLWFDYNLNASGFVNYKGRLSISGHADVDVIDSYIDNYNPSAGIGGRAPAVGNFQYNIDASGSNTVRAGLWIQLSSSSCNVQSRAGMAAIFKK